MQLACIYSNLDGGMNKLDAISMPDNDSNCPIKTRNDVTRPRNAITSASMLSRTYVAIKRPSPTFIAYMSTDFWELLNQYNSFKERGVCDWIENVLLDRSQSCKEHIHWLSWTRHRVKDELIIDSKRFIFGRLTSIYSYIILIVNIVFVLSISLKGRPGIYYSTK